MSSFNARLATPAAAAADPSKHVNYSFGMVLGVDDFTQEFAYLAGRDRWLARDVLGYGTVAGLAVSVEKNSATGETEVVVTPGAALSPRGQLIRVAPTQCASLTKWLASERNVQRIRDRVGVPPVVPLRLYVVLCYRECPTDVVPIPGEPCRTEEDATAPSRVQDDFLLELRFDPPEQTEEDALRDFIKWLNDHVEITDAPGPLVSLDEFLQTLRRSAEQPASPVSPPDFMRDLSPPAPAHMRIAAADACSYLRAAFRLWTTELRTRWRAPNLEQFVTCTEAPAAPPTTDDAVLLAELQIPLNAEGRLREDIGVTKREERRPYLLHLRMLQEWLLCARFDQAAGTGSVLSPLSPPAPAEAAHTFATLYLKSPTVIRALLHHPKPLNVPVGGVRIEAAETPNPIAPQPASVTQLAANLNVFDLQLTGPLGPLSRVTVRFDATKIKESGAGGRTLLSVLNEHTGSFMLDRDGSTLLAFLGVDSVALNDLSDVDANAPQESQVLTFRGGRWIADTPSAGGGGTAGPAGGDLEGTYPNPTVARLRGRPVNPAAAPAAGQVLIFDGNQWTPGVPPVQPAIKPGDPAGGDLLGQYPNPVVVCLQKRAVNSAQPNNNDVLTWDAPGNQWRPQALPAPPRQPVLNLLPFATLVVVRSSADGSSLLRCWFNIDAPQNQALIKEIPQGALLVRGENSTSPEFMDQRQVGAGPVANERNLFDVRVTGVAKLLRFIFDVNTIKVQVGGQNLSVLQYMTATGINFAGFDGSKSITVFVPQSASA